MQGMERKAYKCRFYPKEPQTYSCVRRYVYHGALALRTVAWFEHYERTNDAETDRFLVRVKRAPEKFWLAEVSCVPLHKAPRHLNAAFVRFFAGRVQYRRLHRKHDRQSPPYRIGGFRWKERNRTLAIRWTRPVGAEPTSITVRKDPAGRSFVSCSTEEDVSRLPKTNATVGIDLGLRDVVAMSTGEKVENERVCAGTRSGSLGCNGVWRVSRKAHATAPRRGARWPASPTWVSESCCGNWSTRRGGTVAPWFRSTASTRAASGAAPPARPWTTFRVRCGTGVPRMRRGPGPRCECRTE